MKVYVAGPMRGYKDWNREAFLSAKKRWEAAGHQVFCPMTVGCDGLGYKTEQEVDPHSIPGASHLRHVMLSDFAAICAADAVAVLPGWEHSAGATVEVALAQFLGTALYNAVTMNETGAPAKPWAQPRPCGTVTVDTRTLAPPYPCCEAVKRIEHRLPGRTILLYGECPEHGLVYPDRDHGRTLLHDLARELGAVYGFLDEFAGRRCPRHPKGERCALPAGHEGSCKWGRGD